MTTSSGEQRGESAGAAAGAVPSAIVEDRGGGLQAWWPWLAPLAALLVVAVLVMQSVADRGRRVTLVFADGHGLKPNDPIVYRGIQVGKVHEVGLDRSGGKVRVLADLSKEAAFLASRGRFWIVRPEVSLSRVSGLETLLGPRYIAAEQGDAGAGLPQTFDSPPTGLVSLPGLNVVLMAGRGGSLSIGSPVSYREVPVGTVTNLSLSDDAKSVSISVNIRPEHARLVRGNTRFWNTSGIGLDVGLIGGLKLKAESLQTILAGGLAFATPDKPGEAVSDGQVFAVEEYDEGWLKWSPDLSR